MNSVSSCRWSSKIKWNWNTSSTTPGLAFLTMLKTESKTLALAHHPVLLTSWMVARVSRIRKCLRLLRHPLLVEEDPRLHLHQVFQAQSSHPSPSPRKMCRLPLCLSSASIGPRFRIQKSPAPFGQNWMRPNCTRFLIWVNLTNYFRLTRRTDLTT